MPFNEIRNIREHKSYPGPSYSSMSSEEQLVQRGTCGRQPQSDCTVGSSQRETFDPASEQVPGGVRKPPPQTGP